MATGVGRANLNDKIKLADPKNLYFGTKIVWTNHTSCVNVTAKFVFNTQIFVTVATRESGKVLNDTIKLESTMKI